MNFFFNSKENDKKNNHGICNYRYVYTLLQNSDVRFRVGITGSDKPQRINIRPVTNSFTTRPLVMQVKYNHLYMALHGSGAVQQVKVIVHKMRCECKFISKAVEPLLELQFECTARAMYSISNGRPFSLPWVAECFVCIWLFCENSAFKESKCLCKYIVKRWKWFIFLSYRCNHAHSFEI